ncbi:putative 4,5-DOPA dioxygenase extradiol [Zopfochytrium polystomum]|nr:putative 4,5-DOPA dioxygenase extradiol [Zopfochytrium polystomum]
MTPPRQPSYFLAHGNPSWLVSPELSGPQFLVALGKQILAAPVRPRAVVVVSAHWETAPELRVTTNAQHSLLYDYYNFPAHFYDVKYPAAGAPDVAAKASGLLNAAGFKVADETERGLDHGAFTILLYLFPNQEIPVIQLSLPDTTDPAAYLKMGRALAPLRDDNVLIVGGGIVTHNLGVFRQQRRTGEQATAPPQWANDFVAVVRGAVLGAKTAEERAAALLKTFEAPSYKMASPTPDHYAPLLVAAGAGLDDEPELINEGWDPMTFSFSDDSYRFGPQP